MNIIKRIQSAPAAALCYLTGWRRDTWGRLYRKVRPDDPPSAMFDGSKGIWMEGRWAGGERVVTWHHAKAVRFDFGMIESLIAQEPAE